MTVSPDGTRVAATALRRRRASSTCASATSRPASSCSRPTAGPWPIAPTAAGWPSGPRMRRPCSSWMRERTRRPPDSVATRSLSSGPPSVPTAAASPRAVRTARFALWQIDSGACQVLRGHTDEVFAAAFHPDGTRLATARPRPGGLAVGPGAGRGGGAAAGPHELRLVAGLQPRRRDAGVRLRRLHGPPVGHGAAEDCATRRAARPRPCDPRPNGWWSRYGASRTTRPRSLQLSGPTSAERAAPPRGLAGGVAPGAARQTVGAPPRRAAYGIAGGGRVTMDPGSGRRRAAVRGLQPGRPPRGRRPRKRHDRDRPRDAVTRPSGWRGSAPASRDAQYATGLLVAGLELKRHRSARIVRRWSPGFSRFGSSARSKAG